MIYAKIRENGEYHSPNFAHAASGFMDMGAEVRKYHKIDEIYDEFTKEDIALDYIDQVNSLLYKFGISPICEDYPKELQPLMGRKIWEDHINSINSNPDKWGVFVKPKRQKAFTGKIINNTKDLIGCGSCYENCEVICSEVIDIKSEWRGFITYDKLVDIRPYTGDYHYVYNPTIIDKAVHEFLKISNRPMGCSLDFAVIEDKGTVKTVFLEMNDGYSLGNYGLVNVNYAKLISARWSQLLNRKDEFDFCNEGAHSY